MPITIIRTIENISKVKLLLITLLICTVSTSSYAGILFQDDFDEVRHNEPMWVSESLTVTTWANAKLGVIFGYQ